ncbi:MAG TPA: thiamine phosphate synthase [Desulfobacteraceae bacterium]|nr:thiamine phosphate synthase [Desulfobacteraceae bacterium]HPJ67621.1 thiamine phosphate synthase [Desulfobacteraceae bacterium]HPQ28565.1 thiamine phosphate synthase [Desulfobacteraceae bacterium]
MDFNLYCFSPGQFLKGRDPVEIVTSQIKGGADVIQLREKEMSRRERLELGFKLRDITRKYGVLFIVNDDVDLAIILDADGVHLGQDDIPIKYVRPLLKDKIIGISTHSFDQIKEALDSGADYIGIGPVFDTITKKDRENTVGLELISKAKDICSIPYVAIGGIKKENINSLVDAGCNRAAIISDILSAPDIENQCRFLKGILMMTSRLNQN